MVKRAEAGQIGAPALQGHKILDHFLDPGPFKDLIYTFSTYHSLSNLGLSTISHKYEKNLLEIQSKDTIFVRQ